MNTVSILEQLGSIDIYLLDQIMKGRYLQTDKILDAGCGTGRNLHWFLKETRYVYAIDLNPISIAELKMQYPLLPADRLQSCAAETLPFDNNYFDHIISSAVLHFANGLLQFEAMMKEMVRVLAPGGSIFIRMTSDIGLEDKVRPVKDGVYQLPDGSTRFLLTRPILQNILRQYRLSFMEPLKTVNVNDQRCMSTLVLQKN